MVGKIDTYLNMVGNTDTRPGQNYPSGSTGTVSMAYEEKVAYKAIKINKINVAYESK